MRLLQVLALTSYLVFGTALGASNEKTDSVALPSIPPGVLEALGKAGVAAKFSISTHVNPFYIQGDFNGDRKLDCAILVRNRASGKIGVAIVHMGKGNVSIIGAGTAFGSGGDDFAWMDAWYAYPRGKVSQGADEDSPPKLKGDALLMKKTESASGLAYWGGTHYKWYQQGD